MSDQSAGDYVWVLGLDDEEDAPGELRGSSIIPKRLERAAVPVDVLECRMRDFVAAVGRIIGDVPNALGSYSVDTITISAEISATGKVSFLGSGGELGGKGGISFTLTRRRAAQEQGRS
jgi:hypothetical protein